MRMEIFYLEPEKPTLKQEMEDEDFRKKILDCQLPVTPADEFFDNKHVTKSKGTVTDLTGKY